MVTPLVSLAPIVIYDTEFTAWPGSSARGWSGRHEHREIIQIAAVKVQIVSSGVEILETFNELVMPCINSTLSEYIINLTGISQQMLVDLAIDFPSCYRQFCSFIGNKQTKCLSWGDDRAVLLENCDINGCNHLWQDHESVNLRQLAQNKNLPGAGVVSGEIARTIGLDLQGHVHNALHDVRSIALALEYWITNHYLSSEELLRL
ncbi:MAG: exonuclease domain-containing protein [Aestuariibacter sp.]